MEDLIGVITTLGLPTALVLYYLYKADKDKKEFNEKLDKKDSENRDFTNKLVDNLHGEISELKDERKADKSLIEDIVNTNSLLAKTNSELHNTIVNVDAKIDNIDKKVDKIEIILEAIK